MHGKSTSLINVYKAWRRWGYIWIQLQWIVMDFVMFKLGAYHLPYFCPSVVWLNKLGITWSNIYPAWDFYSSFDVWKEFGTYRCHSIFWNSNQLLHVSIIQRLANNKVLAQLINFNQLLHVSSIPWLANNMLLALLISAHLLFAVYHSFLQIIWSYLQNIFISSLWKYC